MLVIKFEYIFCCKYYNVLSLTILYFADTSNSFELSDEEDNLELDPEVPSTDAVAKKVLKMSAADMEKL